MLDISKDMIAKRHSKIGSEDGKSYANLSMRFLLMIITLVMSISELNNLFSFREPLQILGSMHIWSF